MPQPGPPALRASRACACSCGALQGANGATCTCAVGGSSAAAEVADADADAPHFSLVSGRLAARAPTGAARWQSSSSSTSSLAAAALASSGGVDSLALAQQELSLTAPGTAGAYLASKREWRGLSYEVGPGGASTEILEGRRGIAAAYECEGKVNRADGGLKALE
jgi:hypothetical protein